MYDAEELTARALRSTGIPVERGVYRIPETGKTEVYLVYWLLHEAAEVYADGGSLGRYYEFGVDVVSKGDARPTVERVFSALAGAGFYNVRIVSEAYDEELGNYHVVIEGSYTEV